MKLGNDNQQDSQAATAKGKAANQSRQSVKELSTVGKGLEPPPAPCTHNPPKKNNYGWRENTKLGLEIFGLLILIVYTVFSGLQWVQIRWTNRLTREALDGNNEQLQQTLSKMQGQINQMSRLADNAGRQADKTKDLADRATDQARANQQAANAATSAADTAKDAFRTSERAYVVNGPMTMDEDKKIVKFNLVNSGHVPSGVTSTTYHWATADIRNPFQPESLIHTTECHWSRSRVESVTPGSPWEITIPVQKLDKDKLRAMQEQVVVGGYIHYHDGFPDTPMREWPFCIVFAYRAAGTAQTQFPCDYFDYIPRMEKCDRYPANETK